MSGTPVKPRRWPRIIGALLLAAGGVCVFLFTQHVNDTLLSFGFPRAWAGASALLGAAFCGITGGFLLAQRRFSLGALMAAGIVAAIVATGAQAYVMSIHSIAMQDFEVSVPSDRYGQEFIARVQQLLNSDRLARLANDVVSDSEAGRQIDFNSVSVSFRPVPEVTSDSAVIVTLTFDYSPFAHRVQSGRRIAWNYSKFVARFDTYLEYESSLSAAVLAWKVAEKLKDGFRGPDPFPGTDETIDVTLYLIADLSSLLHKRTVRGRTRDTVIWLRDHEPDARLKQFFSDVLKDFDRLTNETGK